MKLCIVSDSHDRSDLLLRAVQLAIAEAVHTVIHCGDIISADTLRGLRAMAVTVHAVHGNNIGSPADLVALANEAGSRIHYHGEEAQLLLGDRRIFVTHYPDRAESRAATGDCDIACCGHSHHAEIRTIGNPRGGTLLINPGTVAGIRAAPTYAVGDLQTLEFSIRPL
jgi:putative phosphoesterase